MTLLPLPLALAIDPRRAQAMRVAAEFGGSSGANALGGDEGSRTE
jgi:hypothetical protein